MASHLRHPQPQSPSAAASAIKLNRRWSFDNLAETLPPSSEMCCPVDGQSVVGGGGSKEGYVRDLRRQHQMSLSSIKDEEYPYMLTEHSKGGGSNGSGQPAAAAAAVAGTGHPSPQQQQQQQQLSPKLRSRLLGGNRVRSGSMDLGKFPSRARPCLGMMGARPSNFAFSSSVDISVVPEDEVADTVPTVVTPAGPPGAAVPLSGPPSSSSSSTPTRTPSPLLASSPSSSAGSAPSSHSQRVPKFHPGGPKMQAALEGKTKAFLRQRSSSLPRILPPILDSEDSAGGCLERAGLKAADPDSPQQQGRKNNREKGGFPDKRQRDLLFSG